MLLGIVMSVPVRHKQIYCYLNSLFFKITDQVFGILLKNEVICMIEQHWMTVLPSFPRCSYIIKWQAVILWSSGKK